MSKTLEYKLFKDRIDAAKHLYEELPIDFIGSDELIVLALSDGAVVIADFLAQKIGCKMDMLLSESIYSQKNPDFEIAKVSETQEVLIDKKMAKSFDISEEFIYSEAKRIFEEKLLYRINRFRKGLSLDSFEGKVVLLVDECVETDFTMSIAIKTAISNRAKNIYLAAPVIDQFSYEKLVPISDGIFTPYRKRDYISIEYYYDNLDEVEASEIERILKKYE